MSDQEPGSADRDAMTGMVVALLVVIGVVVLLAVVLGPGQKKSCVREDLGQGAYAIKCHNVR